MTKSTPIILSLGGSLVVPNGGIEISFLSAFNAFIRKKIAKDWRFFIVVGGGATARHYIEAARGVAGSITNWDLDWLGIHTTRLNAHLLRTIFRDIAHPRIIANYEKKIVDLRQTMVVAAGWKPGRSTDYDAVLLARDYKAKVIINMSNIAQVYDKDPKQNRSAKPISRISWDDFEKLVGGKWLPGSNYPFDPVASKLAKKLKLSVYVLDGRNLSNLDRAIEGKKFVGTIIE